MLLLFVAVFSFGIFFISKKSQALLTAAFSIFLAVISSRWAINVLFYDYKFFEKLPLHIWGSNVAFEIDKLSAIFILIINLICVAGSVYGIENIKMYPHKTKHENGLHFVAYIWLHLSMLMVTMLASLIPFLFAWELMTVSSFLLVLYEGEKVSTMKAGISYLVQMHVGVLFLIIAMIIGVPDIQSATFADFSTYFSQNNNIPLFLLFFVGFGIKAGFVPLHTWLPYAHPAAPSHVSGVMSGVMIKMGIFGILKIILQLHSSIYELGIIVLVVSILTGLYGIALAIFQNDFKKLLAYSSIENIGIIGIGIGVGMIGLGTQNPLIAGFGFGGALLHTFNHSLFKSLLFFSSGSVYKATHTRELGLLGGITKKMPLTSILFLLAALAICGLPPFNGFISEFIIYKGFVAGMHSIDLTIKVLFVFALTALVLIGGMAVFCFTKAYGTIFLGTPRSQLDHEPIETSWFSLLPQFIIFTIIISIGIFPSFYIHPFIQTANMITGSQMVMFGSENIQTPATQIGFFNILIYTIILVLLGIRWMLNRNKPVQEGPTWGCGYNGATDRMQYTPNSFTENYVHIAANVVKSTEKYQVIKPMDFFPANRTYISVTQDTIEKTLNKRVLRRIERLLRRFGILQTGYIHHYILYAFVLLIVLILLTVANLI